MKRLLKIIVGIFAIKLAIPILLILFVIFGFVYLGFSESSTELAFEKEMTIKMYEVHDFEKFIIKVENSYNSEINVTYSLQNGDSRTLDYIESGETKCGTGKSICITNLGKLVDNNVKIKVTIYE